MKAKYRIRATKGDWLNYRLERKTLLGFWVKVVSSDSRYYLEEYLKDLLKARLHDAQGKLL